MANKRSSKIKVSTIEVRNDQKKWFKEIKRKNKLSSFKEVIDLLKKKSRM